MAEKALPGFSWLVNLCTCVHVYSVYMLKLHPVALPAQGTTMLSALPASDSLRRTVSPTLFTFGVVSLFVQCCAQRLNSCSPHALQTFILQVCSGETADSTFQFATCSAPTKGSDCSVPIRCLSVTSRNPLLLSCGLCSLREQDFGWLVCLFFAVWHTRP